MAAAMEFLRPTMLFSVLFVISPVTYSMSEAEALLNLKSSFTNVNSLGNWVANSVPCTEKDRWEGVTCSNGAVTGLRLEGMGLSGKINIDALLEIKGLRTVSLMRNSFSGSIPEFNRIGVLRAIYLSRNQFSGEISADYFKNMGSLKKLWLSDNKFTGHIPPSIAQIPYLIEIRLENNQFDGNIPQVNNISLQQFNVSNNLLEGQIPASLSKFTESSFAGNSGLCGDKLNKSCDKPSEKPKPTYSGKIAGIAAAIALLIAFVIFLIVRSKRKKSEDFDMIRRDSNEVAAVEVQVSAPVVNKEVPMRKTTSNASRRRTAQVKGGSGGVGELVMVNNEKGEFAMTDLMKAAAEVLGNGGSGSSYKAVMANGVAVVVKRIRDMNALGKDDFDAEMRKMGRLRHWNILTPLAYHYRKDEKLIVSEYVPKGSLLFLLHGDRGTSFTELDWPARLRIIKGIANGMRYLHTERASSDLPHGNLKSSNILLGPDYEPLLVDYGLSNMVNPANLTQALFAYKAPEAANFGKVSPKCDVYCLGVVTLEIITGKFPSQYVTNGKGGTDVVQWVASAISEGRESELLDPEIASCEESLSGMGQLLRIGAECTESNPEQRLDMTEAIKRIEEVKTEGGQEKRTIEFLPSLRDGFAEPANESSTEGKK
ncbi:hypothetical protein L6164_004186 [Bauhinia variegata]|uniref:Uncharacterized protein n=3 Tax=Bauhinia variegata TaxID=167791 RepID=A0ACB9Q3N3_BAUVA|nr:hypothetical protein L6164_004186 [Bauhinia variegata]